MEIIKEEWLEIAKLANKYDPVTTQYLLFRLIGNMPEYLKLCIKEDESDEFSYSPVEYEEVLNQEKLELKFLLSDLRSS